MKNKSLTLSIVIPVYNEENYLKSCLDAIAAQSVMPDDVIVVDNNSTDKSAEIAKSYKFVTLLHEERQHQVFAQNKGFNSANSDILGRIDADTFLPIDWVAKVKDAFSGDPQLAAVTGGANPYDVYYKKTSVLIFNTYYRIADMLAGTKLLWGANCAIRKKAWEEVNDHIRLKGDVWEDYDLAFCISKYAEGGIRYLEGIDSCVSFRAIHKNFIWQVRYQLRAPRTFLLRTSTFKALIFFILLSLPSLLFIYPLTVLDFVLSKLRMPTARD